MAITDSFTGTNGTGLPAYSANWAYTYGSGVDLQIQSNAAAGASTALDRACERTETGFSADHYAQITLAAVASNASVGVAVRCQGSASGNYYGFYGDTGASYLFENTGATFTQLGSNGAAVAVSDVLKLTASGTTLTPAKNGSTLSPPGAQTDATYSGGKPGVGIWNNSGSASAARSDDFECTDATSAITPTIAWLRA